MFAEHSASLDRADVRVKTEQHIKHEPSSPMQLKHATLSGNREDTEGSGSEHEDELDEESEDNVEEENEDDDENREEFGDRIKVILSSFDQPYDPSLEPSPRLPAYHPSFAKVEAYCSEIVEGAVNLLKTSEYQDAETAQLAKHILEYQNIKYPHPRRIGLLGDSGVGKSALINSLLDTPDLALEGSSGSACTCVVTEFQQAWPTQTAPFAAEIIFFEPRTRESILRDHLQDYYHHHFETKEGFDKATLEEREHRASTALEAFRALFTNRKEFASDEAATEFLCNATCADDKSITEKLFAWTKELISHYGAEDGLAYRTADTAEELGGCIESFVRTSITDDDEHPTPSAWPIVRAVRIGLRSNLLKRGLVIADLPGLSDVNKTRTRLTERYIRQCDFVFLVAPISRVQTDIMVQRRLVDGFRAYGSRKALICTYIDLNLQKAKPRDLLASSEDAEEYKRLSLSYLTVNKEFSRVTTSLKKLKGMARKDAAKQIKKLSLKKKALIALQLEALVKMRNKKVVNAMRKKYREITSDPHPLPISCVSNFHYSQQKAGYFEDAIPLSLKVTGIPPLRLSALRLPATSKLNVLRQHCEAKPREASEGQVAKYVEEIKSHLTRCLLDPINGAKEKWVHSGNKLAETWLTWHYSTFGAWCRHDGSYSTKCSQRVSWNAELLAPVAKDLEGPWRAFDSALKESGEKCLNALAASLDNIREELKDIPGVVAISIEPFMSSLTSKKILLRKCMEDTSAELGKLSRDTRLDATADGSDSYLKQAMNPLYKRLTSKTGAGSGIARRTLLEDAILRGEPFSKIYPGVKDAIEGGLDRKQPEIVERIQRVFDMVLKDFDRMFVVEEIPDPKAATLRLQVQAFVTKAKAKIAGPMTTELARAMAKSSPHDQFV